MRRLSVAIALMLGAALFVLQSDASAEQRSAPPIPFLGSCIDFAPDACGDSDGDGYSNTLELETGSDRNNANSTPEYGLLDEQAPPHDTCRDGIDNDLDGRTDQQDSGCHVTCQSFKQGPGCTDHDQDGWATYMELALGSDPSDGLSTPEFAGFWALAGVCSDGIDNDRDGLIDAADPGCAPF